MKQFGLICAAVHTAEKEFAAPGDREAAAEAALLKEVLPATQSYEWLIALSLILDDTSMLAGRSFSSKVLSLGEVFHASQMQTLRFEALFWTASHEAK